MCVPAPAKNSNNLQRTPFGSLKKKLLMPFCVLTFIFTPRRVWSAHEKKGDRVDTFASRRERTGKVHFILVRHQARGEVVQARVIKADCLLEQRLRRSAP
jgi:hypothetical protein